jgi:hypothetical protein
MGLHVAYDIPIHAWPGLIQTQSRPIVSALKRVHFPIWSEENTAGLSPGIGREFRYYLFRRSGNGTPWEAVPVYCGTTDVRLSQARDSGTEAVEA